jgi:hypothetical protein
VKAVAGIAHGARAGARLTLPRASTAALVAALGIFVTPVRAADLDYGPYGAQPYGYQPPPYDYRVPVYPPRRYVPEWRGGYDEPRYGYQGYRTPPYPAYRVLPEGYDHGDRGYRRYGSAEPYYAPYGGYDRYADAPRPPAPIVGPPRGWAGDPRALPDDRWVDAEPPYQPWSPYPPRRW